ncbi:hypothetical protein HPB51_017111 [Rhipicephalus microplus]|uniref:HTH CENPB-type domain-containing protein n=1 Tax=Rhipicephalus microplus TaxID=6941 RepID=A0A9J6ENH0_RHIMP|nr:hypothetical protein HPB51_017111 [Rhipicephalus microplus]
MHHRKIRYLIEFIVNDTEVQSDILNVLASGTSAQWKKMTQLANEELDKAVYAWFWDTRAKRIPISGSPIQQEALSYACILGINENFGAIAGWLNQFKERHEIVRKLLCGESTSADRNGVPIVDCV